MLEVENLAEFTRGLYNWLEACEEAVNEAYRGFCVQVFKYVVQGTPEWTGNLAASWRLTVGAPAVGYDETYFKGLDLGGFASDPEPFSKLSPNYAAIRYAYAVAAHEVPFIRLGADVFITNNAPYAEEVEQNRRASDGRAFLRQVNLPVEMVHAAFDKFSTLGTLSDAKVEELRKEKLA